MSAAEKIEFGSNSMPSRNTAVYGPFVSARHGRALGINPFGDRGKICSLNCAYCDLGTSETRLNRLKEAGFLPSAQEILDQVRDSLRVIHEQGPAVDTLILSGNGEPTLHPEFPELVSGILQLRDLWMPGKRIVVLTNGASLDQRKISDAMNRVDERVVKIDAGNEKMFKTLNSPLARVNLAKILSGVKSLKDLSLQAMFCKGVIDNTQASDIEDWIEVVAILKPKLVHIQGVSRNPAVPGILRCDEDTLHTISSKLERRLGLRAVVTP